VRLPWLGDLLRHAGLHVIDHGQPKGRGRDLARVHGVVLHDTVTPPAVSDRRVADLLRDGHSTLSGPLAQLGLDRQGRFWWIADGRCNHNGFGTWGNDSIGIETFANGGGNPREPWNRSQVEAATVATAAILRRLGLPADRVKGHRETDPARKIDPFGVDLDSIRSQVARSLTAPDDQEDPMAALGPPLTVAVCPDPNDPGGPTHMWLVENWGTPIPPKYARLDGDAAARWRNRAERADLAYVDFRPDYQAAWLAGHQRIADIT
jgi:hypothetical protein